MSRRVIRLLGPRLKRHMAEFAKGFPRTDTLEHLTTYVRGQLAEEPVYDRLLVTLAEHLAFQQRANAGARRFHNKLTPLPTPHMNR